MSKAKAWTSGAPGEPSFSKDFEIKRKAVLQVTDIKTNRNKYYAIELHSAEKGKNRFRVYTHYGRTDDLETNPDAGQKESRYFDSLPEAESCYQQIYRQKTSPSKGYREVALASSKIGSARARGTSVGEIDPQTLARIAEGQSTEENGGVATIVESTEASAGGKSKAKSGKKQTGIDPRPEGIPKTPLVSKLHPGVQELVRYIYDEAKGALTETVSAKITANGIETPLGILTLGQIEKGETILKELYDLFQKRTSKSRTEKLTNLSGEFYTVIPHRIGRSRQAVGAAVIDTLPAFEQKQQTLQLMKDMLQVNGEQGSVLYDSKVDQEYEALGAKLDWLDPTESEFKEISDYVIKSQLNRRSLKIKNLFRIRRHDEWESYAESIGNDRLLFHGSRISNWVGILSRGILLPKIVVSMGVHRTDAGWLGHGIYFGDAACTSVSYTTPGRRKTRLMTVARVVLGKIKQYHKITYGLSKPPDGFDSCHGVRRQKKVKSEFDDDEFVIYDTNQQRLEYLVEFSS